MVQKRSELYKTNHIDESPLKPTETPKRSPSANKYDTKIIENPYSTEELRNIMSDASNPLELETRRSKRSVILLISLASLILIAIIVLILVIILW